MKKDQEIDKNFDISHLIRTPKMAGEAREPGI